MTDNLNSEKEKFEESKSNIPADKIKEKLDLKSGIIAKAKTSYISKKILAEKEKLKSDITEQCNDIIPVLGTTFNQVIEGKTPDEELKKILSLSEKQITAIKKSFIPLAIKYEWNIGQNLPELMFALAIGTITVEKFILFKEYKKLHFKKIKETNDFNNNEKTDTNK